MARFACPSVDEGDFGKPAGPAIGIIEHRQLIAQRRDANTVTAQKRRLPIDPARHFRIEQAPAFKHPLFAGFRPAGSG